MGLTKKMMTFRVFVSTSLPNFPLWRSWRFIVPEVWPYRYLLDAPSSPTVEGREERNSRRQLPLPKEPPYTARVSNLPWTTTEEDIQEHFTGCEVISVRVIRKKGEDRSKGFGFVEYATIDGLVKALSLDGAQLGGRCIRIGVAKPLKHRTPDNVLPPDVWSWW